MAYKTQDEIMDLIGRSGQYWSDADKELARRDPDAGMTIYHAKNDYLNAKDDAGRTTANQKAESARKQFGGYTAGATGAGFAKDSTYFTYDDPYAQRMDAALDKLLGYGDFENPYQGQIDETLGKITSRDPFSYDAETDPMYQQYRKTYLREGQRANEDTMGNYATMTGGQASTAAVNAASQAQDYYNAQMADKIPELYQLAYQMYADEGNNLLNQLSAVRGLGQDALSAWGANLGLAQEQLGALQTASDTGYNRAYNKWGADYQVGRDAVSDRQWQSQFNLANQERTQDFVSQLAQLGVRPTEATAKQTGLNHEDWYALADKSKELQLLELARQAAGGGSGGRKAGGKTKDKATGDVDIYNQLFQSGATDYGTAYAVLRAAGYNTTDAGRYAKYYEEIYFGPAQEQAQEQARWKKNAAQIAADHDAAEIDPEAAKRRGWR